MLRLLEGLTADEWTSPTAATQWDVKAVALHLLDDDLGWLSRHRDEDSSGLLTVAEHGSFVEALDAKNQRWVEGTRGLSPRVIIDLLRWAGREMDQWWATIDLLDKGGVIWASDGEVPEWFDIAQDLTERWVHQMHIREAVGLVDDYSDRYLATVLETFIWAMPHQYRALAPLGTRVNVCLGLPESWHLECVDELGRWELQFGVANDPAASLSVESDAAWRLLTGAEYKPEALTVRGDPNLAGHLLKVRGIIV